MQGHGTRRRERGDNGGGRRPGETALSEPVQLVELAHDAILITELPADVVVFWSRGALDTYGWTADEALGKVSQQLLRTGFPVPREQIIDQLERSGGWEGRLRRRRKGGLEAVVESRWALLPAAPGGRHVAQVDTDITRRVAMETALREVEQHLRNVFDHSPLGICTMSLDGRIVTGNPTLERMLGLAPGGSRGCSLARVIHPDDVAAVMAMYGRMAAGDTERLAVERRFRRSDGSLFWGRLTASAVHDAGGAVHYCVTTVEDVDDRRRVDAALDEINARLESLSRAKSVLLSGVSHEFRTALTGIEGLSEVLRDQDLEPEEMRAVAADVNAEARRLGRLIDDLLDLDRLEYGPDPLRRQTVHVNALLTALADRARRGGSGARVELRLDARLPPIAADPDRVTQVFANLLSNAVKYSPAGSLIEVTSEHEDGRVRVAIRDRGPGIPPDSLERVFDRYTRLEREVRAGVVGTGLGLPIVRQIVAMHRGRVWARNAAGGGAVLTVELPVTVAVEDAGEDRLL